MSADVGTRILSLLDALDASLDPETDADVRDWVNHSEWLLALEVLAEHSIDRGARFEPSVATSFREVVTICGGDPGRYVALFPGDSDR